MKRAPAPSLARSPSVQFVACPAQHVLSWMALVTLLLFACSDRGPTGDSSAIFLSPSSDAYRLANEEERHGYEYRIRAIDSGKWSAVHPQMQLDARFEVGRVALTGPRSARAPAEPVNLAARAWGCPNSLAALPPTVPEPSELHPGALEYRHANIDEWYLPGPAGLEQGFTIQALPGCAARGEPLQIRLVLGGEAITATSAANGEASLNAPGSRTIHYGQAFAQDARGKELPVRIRTDSGLALELDVSGAQLPIAIDPLAWVEVARVAAQDGSAGDYFGKAIAASGDTLLVGAYGDDDRGTDSGSAYVFVRTGGAWSLQQKLTVTDGAAGDAFGYSVALSGETAVVGAYLADGAAADSGAAYVFTRSGSTWTQQAKLIAADAAAGDHLATSLAISGQTVVLGAPLKRAETGGEAGAAYVFSRNGSVWSQQAKFTPTNNAGDHNGTAVAISGNQLAVGTARPNGYLVSFYSFNGNSWSAAGNVSSNNANFAYYGSVLAMSATYTVIGSYAHPLGPSGVNGTVLVISNATHSQQYSLRANDGSVNDLFGRSVAISDGNVILVGSPQDDDLGDDSGSAFAFGFNGNAWTQQQKLLASDGKTKDGFGSSVAITASAAFSGAWQGSSPLGSGFVSVEALGQTGAACTQSNECQSGFCVEGVCCASACNGVCQSCLQKNKASNGGVDGVCGSVKLDTDPRDSCLDSGADSCGTTGLCDGKGACSVRAPGSSCTFPACAGPTSSTLSSACNGSGECKPTATVPCQLGYACVLGNCRSGCFADTDCDGSLGFICTEEHVCKQPKGAACTNDVNCSTGTCQYGHCCLADREGVCPKPLGTQCILGSECASSMCTDGVCCSSPACNFCQSCSIAGSQGNCGPLATAPPDTPGQAVCAAGGRDSTGGDGGNAGTGTAQGVGGTAGQPISVGGSGSERAAGGDGGAQAAGIGGDTAGRGGSVSDRGGMSARGGEATTAASGNGASTFGGGAANTSASAGLTGTGGGQFTVECSTDADCSAALSCDPANHVCRDQLVTACGCRVAGSRASSQSWIGLAALAVCGAAARRRGRNHRGGGSRKSGSSAPRRSSFAMSS